MSTAPTIESLSEINKKQAAIIAQFDIKFNAMVEQFTFRVDALEKEIAVLKNKKNSNNSHMPPTQDPNRPKKNQSLRQKSGKKPGGQPGHPGNTLLCSELVDEIIEHRPTCCDNCGKDLSRTPETLLETRQVVDIPPIQPIYTEHQIFEKICSCGHCMQSNFPAHVAASIQYGPNVEAMTGYLHTRQYMPYQRMQEFFNDIMHLPLSVGGINNILNRFTKKAEPFYNNIKEQIQQASFVGTDETSVKINGKNHWMWTWQNGDLTFLLCSKNRGFDTIENTFVNGLPNAILQHDRYACHFNCEAKAHNICMAHLLRDFKYIIELYNGDCTWAAQMQTLIHRALTLKKILTPAEYLGQCKERKAIEKKLDRLLLSDIDEGHKKAKTLQKSLTKHRSSMFNFLWYQDVPPDNNGSERAIRNVKVKQKISGQFKAEQGADNFAILRSVIDTTIKAGRNILAELILIAKLGTE